MTDNRFAGLIAVVQWQLPHGVWNNMAAFDSRDVAEHYFDDCTRMCKGLRFRVIAIPENET